MPPMYLTKSRFKHGFECTTKLFYTGKKEYPDQSNDDTFPAKLAEDWFQFSELAKCYYSGGPDITTLDANEVLCLTDDFLKLKNMTLNGKTIWLGKHCININNTVKGRNGLSVLKYLS